jgi:hypothetical protein
MTQPVPMMVAPNASPWQVGQAITLSGIVNGSGTPANDASFNGDVRDLSGDDNLVLLLADWARHRKP